METLNWLAVIVGTAVAFGLGTVWFGPLFGKIWAKGNHDIQPPARPPILAMAAQFLGTFALALVIGLTATINASAPRFWPSPRWRSSSSRGALQPEKPRRCGGRGRLRTGDGRGDDPRAGALLGPGPMNRTKNADGGDEPISVIRRRAAKCGFG